jgi:hypothetical protein
MFMKFHDRHVSDQDLLRELEGELSSRRRVVVRGHLEGCWKCRTRYHEFDAAIADFVRLNQESGLPPGDPPRAMLKARLAEISAEEGTGAGSFSTLGMILALTAAASVLLAVAWLPVRSSRPATVVSTPDSKLTPGATLLVSRRQVCSQSNPNNKMVPAMLQRRVFDEYGIRGADPRAYEVDYLVTPALGGADDIRNLWPHSYSATVWNAHVKDALEDRLREMVCEGAVDLTAAQQEIATNWIAAYKKYFHTDEPLAEHRQ